MAPSLTTGRGELKMGRGLTQQKYRTLGQPVATLELRYETAATLLLRGVLKQGNPAHAAILARFEGAGAAGWWGLGGLEVHACVAAVPVCPFMLHAGNGAAILALASSMQCSGALHLPPAETAEEEQDENAAGPSRRRGAPAAAAAAVKQEGGARKRQRRQQQQQQEEELIDLTKVDCWSWVCCSWLAACHLWVGRTRLASWR